MKSQYISFLEKDKAALCVEELPAPKADEVQVRLAVSTISAGTERANVGGEINVGIYDHFTEAHFPRRSGYSSAGTVVAVGENVTHVKPGDRVAMMWSNHGQINNLPKQNVFKLPDSVSFEQAALLHIAIFPLAAIRKCKLEMGESAMVMGQGILGQFAIKLLRAAGAAPIIAVDPVASKREQALQYGADYALDPYDPEFAQTVKKITGGGVQVAIEVTGIGKGLDGALDCMRKFGRVALLGCTRHSDFTIDYYHKVHGPGISLIGAHTAARPQQDSYHGWWTQQDDMNTLIRLCDVGRLDFEHMIEETHSPAEAPEVYTRLVTEKFFPLVQFDWRRLEEAK